MIRLTNIRAAVPLRADVTDLAAAKLHCKRTEIEEVTVVRRSVDARRKPNIFLVFTLQVTVKREKQILSRCRQDKDIRPVTPVKAAPPVYGTVPLTARPVVVGTGPAGLGAALALAGHGYRPIVLERGYDVDRRTEDVRKFWETGIFNAKSNVQFGEGGAGTFSDGKLTTRVNHPLLRPILEELVEAGAPTDILYMYNPHIGTDILRTVVKRLRFKIERLGGTVRFDSRLTDIILDEGGAVREVVVNDGGRLATNLVILGIGHSARDTYYMLHARHVFLEKKPFAVGVRIEHKQELIDKAQYGCNAAELGLDAAEYNLVYHGPGNRTCYSFCMCPGGTVVAAASEEGRVVTNGMSRYKRDSEIANSALVVNVTVDDMGGNSPLGGIEFQRRYEEAAYRAGGCSYKAPAQTVGDFLGRTGAGRADSVQTYRPGVVRTDLRRVLPEFVTETLAAALPYFGRKIHGFDDNNIIMTGVETRTSAPVRIRRDETTREAVRTKGLYPVGEGAGYAGGIMSAFLDGTETAIEIMKKYRPLEVR